MQSQHIAYHVCREGLVAGDWGWGKILRWRNTGRFDTLAQKCRAWRAVARRGPVVDAAGCVAGAARTFPVKISAKTAVRSVIINPENDNWIKNTMRNEEGRCWSWAQESHVKSTVSVKFERRSLVIQPNDWSIDWLTQTCFKIKSSPHLLSL